MDLRFLNTLCLIFGLIILLLLDFVSALPEYYVEDHCSQTLALNYGTIESVRLRLTKSINYPDGMRCAMRIQAPQGKRLLIRFESFDVHGLQDLQCQSGDYAQFFNGGSDNSITLPGLPQRLCSPPTTKKFVTSGSYLVVRFMSDTDMMSGRGIKLLITAFNDGPCTAEQFKCESSGRCIQKSLECDGELSCYDDSDEAMPKCLSTAAIAGIGVAGGILLIVIIVVIVLAIVFHERRKRARIIKRYPADRFWYETSQPTIDASRIDPIWDGGLSDNKNNTTDEQTAVDKPIGNFADNIPGTRNSSKVIGPGGKEMKKIPSSFWDISLSDLQLMATSSTQTTEI